jgi:hypothetical protein
VKVLDKEAVKGTAALAGVKTVEAVVETMMEAMYLLIRLLGVDEAVRLLDMGEAVRLLDADAVARLLDVDVGPFLPTRFPHLVLTHCRFGCYLSYSKLFSINSKKSVFCDF